jgi:hypothetical protein
MRRKTIILGALALSLLPAAPVGAQQQPRLYHDMADTFAAGIDQKKFIVVLYRNSSTAPDIVRMSQVFASLMEEPILQHIAVFGEVDLARDAAARSMARALNEKCTAAAGCHAEPIAAPAISLFVPDSKNIAELARMTGVQREYAIRNLVMGRICESIQRHDPHTPPMDDELAGNCQGFADSKPSSDVLGWMHVVPREGSFSVEVPGLVQEFNRCLESSLGQMDAHYVVHKFARDTAAVCYMAMTSSVDAKSALQAYADKLPARGKVESVAHVRFAGYPAIRYVVKPDASTRIAGIYFTAGRASYDLLWHSADDDLAAIAGDKFLESFRLAGVH